ncbi:hypothetical protein MP638_002323 [Amoeboaphelidium occidentale]|nr:hypothetical protein MP638_002323 [Amoeboaphelidium occidentale]
MTSMMLTKLIKSCTALAMLFSTTSLSLEHDKSFLLQNDASNIFAIAVDQDSFLFTSGSDIVQKNAETGKIEGTMRGHSQQIQDLAMYGDSTLVSAGWDALIILWDLETGAIMKSIKLEASGTQINSISYQDGFLWTSGVDYKIRQVDLVTGKKLSAVDGSILLEFYGHTDTVLCLCIHNNVLYTGSVDQTGMSWNTETAVMIHTFIGHSGYVYVIRVFNDVLYSAGDDYSIIQWNMQVGGILRRFIGVHINTVRSLIYYKDTLLSGSTDTSVARWNATSGTAIQKNTGHNRILRSVVSWESLAIVAGDDWLISAYETTGKQNDQVLVLHRHTSAVNALFVNEDTLFSESSDTTVRQWNLTTQATIRVFIGHIHTINDVIASEGYMFSAGNELVIKAWDITSGDNVLNFLGHTNHSYALYISGNCLASGGFDNTARKWNLPLRTLEITWTMSSYCYCLISTPYFIYSGHDDGTLRVWRLESLEYPEMMSGYEVVVRSLTFNDQGILFLCSHDGSSVTYLAAVGDSLAVGMNAGGTNFYGISTATVSVSSTLHSHTVTSLVVVNGSIYSSSLDGSLVQESSVVVFNDSSLPIKSVGMWVNKVACIRLLWLSHYNNIRMIEGCQANIPTKSITYSQNVWYAIRGESQIWGLKFQLKLISSLHEALRCITATESLILVGTKGGDVVGMDVNTGLKLFTLTDPTSQVNVVLTDGDYVFSASDDDHHKAFLVYEGMDCCVCEIIIEGIGPFGACQCNLYCRGTLFSAGVDLTTRRWNIDTTKHEDVYFGFSRKVTAVICYNATVFSGSEGTSVLMYIPQLPHEEVHTTTRPAVFTKIKHNPKKVSVQKQTDGKQTATMYVVIIVIVVINALILVGILIYLVRRRKPAADNDMSAEVPMEPAYIPENENTAVNTSMGLSKHGVLVLEPSLFAQIKKLAAGGGGEVFLAKTMDTRLRQKDGDMVIQKVVFGNSQATEESFHQEVAIMVILSKYSYFAQIIGYTVLPLTMIMNTLKYQFVKEIAYALNTMHSDDLAHCDLNTQNILVGIQNNTPVCCLTDFGITQVLSEKIVAVKMFNVVNVRGLSITYASPEAFSNFGSKNSKADFRKYDVYLNDKHRNH